MIASTSRCQTTQKLLLLFASTCITILVLVKSVESIGKHSVLYSNNDEISIITSANFSENVFGRKKQIQLVQFYNSWCGHCISFAPIFKRFAADVKRWKTVVRVLVIDCADDINTNTCREMDINSYPTIKLFWVDSRPDHKGIELKGF